ncbi:MAG: 1-(5-phosphoribosyl)-5-[(5-phosphoribosylamino)methylideneamino]imidazole-4-carboxamide isomerase [Anaerolineae bacterium]|nr:1-(5-phosphoribosyl)-5-[(5-phosphoribosylamino)methylideneamino]imidazole-4-carboxamide isomerase [Anaerolineae bacterium]MDW8071539.1 1-(5-phosphoribosyl)-5-[(5-phosphoribosylamino)methylideneamino]imidazole-4-carboxamide isomerase [Anaerolineae bacterium]
MIIYPAIDLRRGRCVRLKQGDPQAETVFSEDPVATALHWERQGAEWLHVVNLDGALGESDAADANLVALHAILGAVTIPVQLGGGLRSLHAIERALRMGVRRVVLGTVAVVAPEMIEQAVRQFGAEHIAVALDVREGQVAIHGWQATGYVSPFDLAQRIREAGVLRIVYTDIQRDGMLSGVNAATCATLAQETGLRVIVSGGVASLEDIRQVKQLEWAGIEGVIIGRALYMGQVELREALALAHSQV